jgi:hypothetical protein
MSGHKTANRTYQTCAGNVSRAAGGSGSDVFVSSGPKPAGRDGTADALVTRNPAYGAAPPSVPAGSTRVVLVSS